MSVKSHRSLASRPQPQLCPSSIWQPPDKEKFKNRQSKRVVAVSNVENRETEAIMGIWAKTIANNPCEICSLNSPPSFPKLSKFTLYYWKLLNGVTYDHSDRKWEWKSKHRALPFPSRWEWNAYSPWLATTQWQDTEHISLIPMPPQTKKAVFCQGLKTEKNPEIYHFFPILPLRNSEWNSVALDLYFWFSQQPCKVS